MTEAHEEAFKNLLSTWASHQELKASGAPVVELIDSRISLDEARIESRSHRDVKLVQLAC